MRSRETANRAHCAKQLRAIGQALLLYQNDNKGLYPKTMASKGAVVTPTWGTGATATDPFGPGGPEPNDVTAALFLLVRTQDITGEVFVCPSTSLKPWKFGGPPKTGLDWSNWSDVRTQLGYSYANPYVDDGFWSRSKARWNWLRGSFSGEAMSAVAADVNPGVTSGATNLLTISTISVARDMRSGNSPNHGRDGQNVLYFDGHVSFESTPFCGVFHDNIYTARTVAKPDDTRGGAILTSPYDVADRVLLPTAE